MLVLVSLYPLCRYGLVPFIHKLSQSITLHLDSGSKVQPLFPLRLSTLIEPTLNLRRLFRVYQILTRELLTLISFDTLSMATLSAMNAVASSLGPLLLLCSRADARDANSLSVRPA